MAYVYKDDLDHAINLLREAIGNVAQPTREKGWELARLGELYVLDKDDWETGRRYLEQAAEILDPVSQTHAWVHVRLAEGYIGDKEYQKAAVYARKAVELAEKDPRVQAWVHFGAYRAYALALHYGGIDLKEAERQYRRAMKVAEAEDDREAKGQLLAYLGNLYARRKRYRASLRAYNEALRAYGEEAPEIWKLHWSLGSVLSDMGKHQEAADHFRRAVAMLQEMPNALPDDLIDGHMNLGEILYQAKEYAEAEQTFREALRLMPPGDGRRSPAMKWLLAAIQRKE
jgi:tetratricopeptide (TPR) repeat protein